MKVLISSTEAARNLGDCLARIKHTGDSFILTKNRMPIAELNPLPGAHHSTLGDMVSAMSGSVGDVDFANDLEKVNASDQLLENPWL